MRPFAYARPTTFAQALSLLSPTARPKGGGYDLLDLAKRDVATPAILVDLAHVEDDLPLDRIGAGRGAGPPDGPPNSGPEMVSVGARATLAAIAASPLVQEKCPALADAAREAATPQVRNVATAAGNLLQRPRCAYFRDPFFDCRKRGGTTCPAREGVHDEMAIFGNGVCCATHPSNLATALLALGAEVLVVTSVTPKVVNGRAARAAEFFVAPEEDPLREARIAPGELVREVRVPHAPASAYVEVNQKQSYDWASVACAVVLDVRDGKIADARVALGAVAPVPLLSKAAADALRGKSVRDEAAWAAAADAAVVGATPLPRNVHKVRQLRACVGRAVAAAAARSK
jgi:xanthine dehydrogenase YagS FAD-binding subunit